MIAAARLRGRLALLLLALAPDLACVAAPATAARPNVLFIAADDLRPDLGRYGDPRMHTPHLDALAERGLLFSRAYCQVSVCNPSRASVLSGRRPDTIRIYDNSDYLRPKHPDLVTLPQHFKAHGYHTASVGKIFHHSEREPGDDPLAWSEPSWYHGTPHRHWHHPASLAFLAGLQQLPPEQRPRLMRGPPYEAADAADDVYPDAQTAAQAIATLRRLKDRPFFLGVGFVKPHLPFTAPQKYWDLYPAATIRLPEVSAAPPRVPADAHHNLYELRSYGQVHPTADPTEEQARALIRGYRACVSFLDAQVGRVLAALDELGLSENTIVVFWSDHGYHLGENRLWTKMTNFELGTRVPLIVAAPGKVRGRSTAALVELVDLYPSLAELCGLPLPPHLEGTSFVPLLARPDRPWKTAAFSQYARSYNARRDRDRIPMGYSIRTATHRYTEWFDPDRNLLGMELYDQNADPHNDRNMADDPALHALAADLSARLRAGWRAALPP